LVRDKRIRADQSFVLEHASDIVFEICSLGATTEFKFKEEPWDEATVESDLKERSYPFSSKLWDDGTVDKVTSGVRVQSDRGNYGRMPMIGRFHTPIHADSWIFTGLSSRGLLYHGVFGEILTSMILGIDDKEFEHPCLDWWQKK
jgi:hypothetical protein